MLSGVDDGMEDSRILVIGGGISGLLAAWYLHGSGRRVEVWEATDAVGGWVQTLPWPGLRGEPGWLERGPQGLMLGTGGALERLIRDVGLALQHSGSKGPRWLGKGGRRHPGPATIAGLMRAPGLGFKEKVRLLAEPFIPAGSNQDETVHDFFTRRLGEGFARELLPALVAGVMAASPERISTAALPRLRGLETKGGLLIGGLRTGPERTRFPLGGTGALAQILTARLGGCVHTNRPVRALEPLPGGRWRVHSEERSAEVETVVVAVPSQVAAALLRPVSAIAACILEAIPRLDLRIWHSRHAVVEGWQQGVGLLVHPPEGRGLLGAASFAVDDSRGVPGLLQMRTYVGGAYQVEPALTEWAGVFRERHGDDSP